MNDWKSELTAGEGGVSGSSSISSNALAKEGRSERGSGGAGISGAGRTGRPMAVRAALTGPGLDPFGIKRGNLLETLQCIPRPIVGQENLRLPEPRLGVVPAKGDRSIVILNRRTPAAFPFQELPLPMEDRRVLRILSQGPREERFGGVRVAEVQEGISEAEDRAGIVGHDIQDRLEQDDRIIRVAVASQLFRLRDDVTGLRRFDSQGLPERIDRVREAGEPEQEVRAFEPSATIPPVCV